MILVADATHNLILCWNTTTKNFIIQDIFQFHSLDNLKKMMSNQCIQQNHKYLISV